MFSINKCYLVGNLTRDPDLRSTTSGMSVCNFSMATNRSVKDGETYKDVPTFLKIVVWGKLAEFVARELKKGQKVYVDGRIDIRQYTDKEGATKYSTEIVADSVIPHQPKNSSAAQVDQAAKKPETREEMIEREFPNKKKEKLTEDVNVEEASAGIDAMKKEQDQEGFTPAKDLPFGPGGEPQNEEEFP